MSMPFRCCLLAKEIGSMFLFLSRKKLMVHDKLICNEEKG